MKQIEKDPGVVDPIWTILADSPRNQTWQIVCSTVMAAAPTEKGWDLYIQQLPELTEQHFSSWWRQLWNQFPDNDKHRTLRRLAATWLSSEPPAKYSEKVVDKLCAEAPKAATPLLLVKQVRPRGSGGSPDGGQPAASAIPQHRSLDIACLNCDNPIRLPAAGPSFRKCFCWNCASAFIFDTETASLSMVGLYRYVPASHVVKRINKSKSTLYVHCPTCQRTLSASHRRPGAWVALDHSCRQLHSIPDSDGPI
jgi:hypothetical protein